MKSNEKLPNIHSFGASFASMNMEIVGLQLRVDFYLHILLAEFRDQTSYNKNIHVKQT